MFVAVYFNGELDPDRDEVEDLLLDALMQEGEDRAKVTGGGAGLGGCNIDLEVDDALEAGEVLRRIREALRSAEGIPRDTTLQIEDKMFPLHAEGPGDKPKEKANRKKKGPA